MTQEWRPFRCPKCGSHDVRYRYEKPGKAGLTERLHEYHCTACDHYADRLDSAPDEWSTT